MCEIHALSQFSSLQLCMVAPSSMPLAYKRTNWPWILRGGNTIKTVLLLEIIILAFFLVLVSIWLSWAAVYNHKSKIQYKMTKNTACMVVLSYLLIMLVNGRISPSQFHTDAAGALLQHRPHRKGVADFCSFAISCPMLLSVSCCWDPFLLIVSTCPLSSSSNPPVSSNASSSLPAGREKRTAFTRWTSTNGRSN